MEANNNTNDNTNHSLPSGRAGVGALQYGEGNFLRAFVDWMIDVANEQGVTDVVVAVVSPRFRQNKTITLLQQQDCQYHTLLEGVADGKASRQIRQINCVRQAVAPETDYEAYLRIIESPNLRFVFSNTTEAGIRYEQDDVRAQIPATFPGKVTAMLHHRWQHFQGDPTKGIIFICCELIDDNGQQLREYVLRHATEAGLEADFLRWVDEACVFCDSLVDRIVSGLPADLETVQQEIGKQDELVVKGELYHLWAIGGANSDRVREELPLHKAGLNVVFVPSLNEIRKNKVRILNGLHTAMTPIGLLAGCKTVYDAVNHPEIAPYLDRLLHEEILPNLEGDREELERYAQGILERFQNPFINHQLKSIALNSLSKWQTRNLPTARDHYRRTGKPALLTLRSLAALIRLYSEGSGFEPEDDKEQVDCLRALVDFLTE